ncbi:SAM-dependent methyltransferase [Actinomadura sp. 7K507]|uniref:SAM-dependent methyltransferase n=1 Tax=Actinomadura sp. 7K507 TaxID=2530365 RepID=UPI001050D2CD|nr:SAM-dependent methyltransferase [Actinomadura sp. 7K507]TDC89572.1 SAM-dependent methyltransferase [Actinomadura sp. 7K507]
MGSENRKFWDAPDDDPGGRIDTSIPHSARIWNYWLGGKDNFPADQQAGEEYARTFPGIIPLARASREFIGRAVTYLAARKGIRQFLDIGTGLPTENNTHQVAQRAAPDSRIVYVDNDPLVLVHARALLTSKPEGAAHYLEADLHQPDQILTGARQHLDFTQPIALMLMGIIGHVPHDTTATRIITTLIAALPPGSYLALYDGTSTDQAFLEAQQDYDDTGADPYRLRSPDQIRAFFTGLQLVDPGVVPLPHWRPAPSPLPPGTVEAYCGVARKP